MMTMKKIVRLAAVLALISTYLVFPASKNSPTEGLTKIERDGFMRIIHNKDATPYAKSIALEFLSNADPKKIKKDKPAKRVDLNAERKKAAEKEKNK